MRIYLDSRDHIHLTEKFSAKETYAFETMLRRGSHELVFSLHNILECCAPLARSRNRGSMLKLLNQLERMPHAYIAETKIPTLELVEANQIIF
jgi:hypothetical protein